jgi:hypothetical protein
MSVQPNWTEAEIQELADTTTAIDEILDGKDGHIVLAVLVTILDAGVEDGALCPSCAYARVGRLLNKVNHKLVALH